MNIKLFLAIFFATSALVRGLQHHGVIAWVLGIAAVLCVILLIGDDVEEAGDE